jgi:hypothetical protein
MVTASGVRSGMAHSSKQAAEPTTAGLASMRLPILVVDHHFASSLPRERQTDSLGVLSTRIVAELPVSSFLLYHPIATVVGNDVDVGAAHPSSPDTANLAVRMMLSHEASFGTVAPTLGSAFEALFGGGSSRDFPLGHFSATSVPRKL